MKYYSAIIYGLFVMCAYCLFVNQLTFSLVLALVIILFQQFKLCNMQDKYAKYKKLFKTYADMYSKRLKGELNKEV